MARNIKGLSKFRQRLRKIPVELRSEITKTLEDAAEEARVEMQARAPKEYGDMAASITVVKSSDRLSYVVGPGIRGATTIKKRAGSYGATAKSVGGGQMAQLTSRRTGVALNFSARTLYDRFQMMKAYWLEHGTKGRKTKKGGLVGAIRPHRFVKKTRDAIIPQIMKDIDAAVDRTLARLTKR